MNNRVFVDIHIDGIYFTLYFRTNSAVYNIWSWLVDNMGLTAYRGRQKSPRTRMIEMFHSSTDQKTKDWIIQEFTSATSIIRVLVSTIAFGMGVNIPDVEVVIHWGAPKSVVSY